jgi:mannose-6-phosphate isomerase-like protein (cupin superfamily)
MQRVAAEVCMSFDPSQTYVLLAPDGSAVELPGGATFWSRPRPELEGFGQAWLVSEFEFSADWSSWEMHPHADEFVYLLDGAVLFQLQGEAGVIDIPLQGRGAVVVPRGVWHTAKVSVPSRMLFVTLGSGTEHRPA